MSSSMWGSMYSLMSRCRAHCGARCTRRSGARCTRCTRRCRARSGARCTRWCRDVELAVVLDVLEGVET
eukprot:502133-Pyramimonas_sp.AAC.1